MPDLGGTLSALTESPKRSSFTYTVNILQGMIGTSSIVVVDDDLNVLANMERLLESWGANVIAKRTSGEAMEIIVNDQCVPDLVIADYCLEDGNTGIHVIQQVRALAKMRIPGIDYHGRPVARGS